MQHFNVHIYNHQKFVLPVTYVAGVIYKDAFYKHGITQHKWTRQHTNEKYEHANTNEDYKKYDVMGMLSLLVKQYFLILGIKRP